MNDHVIDVNIFVNVWERSYSKNCQWSNLTFYIETLILYAILYDNSKCVKFRGCLIVLTYSYCLCPLQMLNHRYTLIFTLIYTESKFKIALMATDSISNKARIVTPQQNDNTVHNYISCRVHELLVTKHHSKTVTFILLLFGGVVCMYRFFS